MSTEGGSSRSPSYDPSVSTIENRVFVYDPHSEGFNAGLLADTEDDDDDMDYQPAEESLDERRGGEDEDDDVSFEDAEENLSSGLEIEFEIPTDGEVTTDDSRAGGDEEEQEEDETGQRRPTQMRITRAQLIELLGHNGLRQIFAQHYTSDVFGGYVMGRGAGNEDEDDGSSTSTEEVSGWGRFGMRPRRRPKRRGPSEFEKVPSPEGVKLMESGTFGTNERPEDSVRRKKKTAMRLLRRELGLGTGGRETANAKLMRQDFLPRTKADMIINYNARCYSGQFSKDGNFFFSCAQDFRVRMYDTSNPYDWKYYKTVDVPMGSWTITDATLSPDNRFLACSSIRNIVTLASTDPNSSSSGSDYYMLDFAQMTPTPTARPTRTRGWGGYGHFGIWSLRFSGDGREIIAGTGDQSVYVYDLERRQSILRIPGHDDDVNAVCYGDENSPHILYSGSDDSTLKVWDRRSLGDGRAAGVFLGHTEGLTYVDSKGDGRYVLSNGKDQTTKLWDLRKVIPTEEADHTKSYMLNFDYRQDEYDFSCWRPHPKDCSLVTFRGHRVLRTLIRCHFSPPGSSDGRYVYSGSQDGNVWIWNLDGTPKRKIDVFAETKDTRPRDSETAETDYYWGRNTGGWRTVVRDASWHPDVGMIAATSWNGYGTSWGTCTVHSWDDDYSDDDGPRVPSSSRRTAKRVDAQLRHNDAFYMHEPGQARARTGVASRTRANRRAVALDSDDEWDDV